MRIRWRGLELPSRVNGDRSTLSDTYYLNFTFSLSPFVFGLALPLTAFSLSNLKYAYLS